MVPREWWPLEIDVRVQWCKNRYACEIKRRYICLSSQSFFDGFHVIHWMRR